jgi:hypothetical protein
MMVMSICYVKDIMKTIIVEAVRKVLGKSMIFCQDKIVNNNLNKLIYFIIIK